MTRDRVSEICFSLHTNISPLSLSLSLEQHSMLHRRRVRRGPDHGHDRAEVPAHRGKQRASLIKVVFARFITTSSICIIRLQNARVQNVPVFDTPPGPGGGAIFSITRATQSPKRKDRDERLVALLVVFCRRFSSGVGCSLSLSLFRANVTLIRCLLLNVQISFFCFARKGHRGRFEPAKNRRVELGELADLRTRTG